MASRLVLDRRGQLVAEATVPLVDVERGFRWVVLGNEVGDAGFQTTGLRTGRAPAAELVGRRYPASPREALQA